MPTPPPARGSKHLTGPAVAVLGLALIVSGTWAWYDFNQHYSNDFDILSDVDYDPILVDEFQGPTRHKLDWQINDTVEKTIYVTYDHNDPNWDAYAGHTEEPGCEDHYKPTYVRVLLTETLTHYDVDTGTSTQEGPTIYTGVEHAFVEWTLGTEIKTVDQWRTDYLATPSDLTGEFWILDDDGWFYWAQPLAHGETTATILEAVKLLPTSDGAEATYTIDVHMEAIDHGLRDYDKWADPTASVNPTVSRDIRVLFNRGTSILWTPGLESTAYGFGSTVVLDNGIYYAAGGNTFGQLSDGTTTNRPNLEPMMWDLVTPMTTMNVRDMDGGAVSLYIQKTDGTWWAVGQGTNGQLSNGTTTDVSYPVPMKWDPSTPMNDTNVLEFRAGHIHAYILRDDGIWYAVGNQAYGTLSNGTTTGAAITYPIQMLWSAGQPIRENELDEMIINYYTVHLLKKSDNTWYGVGFNQNGQLSIGNGNHQPYPVPMEWSAGTPITGTHTLIPTRSNTTIVVKSDGTYWGVGRNAQNQISEGTVLLNHVYPVEMKWSASEPMTTTNTVKITAHGGFDGFWYALKSDGYWYAQGSNAFGQLSRGTVEGGAVDRYPEQAMWSAGVPMTGATVKDIVVEAYSVRIQKPDGTWWTVGRNIAFDLIDGTNTDRSYPVPMIWGDGTQITTR